MKRILFIIFLFVCLSVDAQSILGKWKTIDDETGKPKSIVEVYEQGGSVYGKVIQLFREPHEVQNPICDKCEDDRKDQLITGMVIIRDMKLRDGYYQDGTICDPKNGKIYKCEFWVDAADHSKLQVRGYWGFFYRTQTWIRV